ncbi:MAG: hypothetical protein ABH881_01280 [bacterium]
MKKILFISILFILFIFSSSAQATEKINIYFFYGDGCPHCAKEEKFLDYLEKTDNNIEIKRYETWSNSDNAKLLARVAEAMDVDVRGVPFTIIGDKTITGYYDDKTTGKKIKGILADYEMNGCDDVVAPIINSLQNESKNTDSKCVHGCGLDDEECVHDCGCSADKVQAGNVPEKITVPIFGEISVKNVSLPILTLVIAGLDGFNPCAMWVLLFLINLLLGMKDRKRMLILGSAFIISSGFVYFLFLAAWLNLFLFLGFILWIRIAIALVALGSGGYSLYNFWKNRKVTCKVESNEKRKMVFENLRKVAEAQKFWIALAGIILLAAAINLVEIVCSAGLPAVYTQVLALSSLPKWQYYFYLLFYIFIYMLDDMVIFFIAMATLKITASESKFAKYSSLIGGAIMVSLGLLLLFRPGWLMF